MTPKNDREHRLIGWNGLTISLPKSWECIVSGASHLLIERNFLPVLEIRWEKESRRSPAGLFDAVLQGFSRQTGDSVKRITPPEDFGRLAEMTGAAALSWESGKKLSGLLWQCSTCNTAVFCRVFAHPDVQCAAQASVLESLACHHRQEDSGLWSIQDIRFVLSPAFSFDNYTLAPGLTRLSFHNDTLKLHYLRLAGAAERLKNSALPQLLETLHAGLSTGETLSSSSVLFECETRPTLSGQMLSRLRRLKPFCWGRIWHDKQRDRILALIAESTRPIDLNIVHSLCDRYEILPIPKPSGTFAQQG